MSLPHQYTDSLLRSIPRHDGMSLPRKSIYLFFRAPQGILALLSSLLSFVPSSPCLQPETLIVYGHGIEAIQNNGGKE